MNFTAWLLPSSKGLAGEGNGNPLQYSCLENPIGRGARSATVHGVAKSLTQLSTYTHMASQVALVVKNLPDVGNKRLGLIPRSDRSPGGGHGN